MANSIISILSYFSLLFLCTTKGNKDDNMVANYTAYSILQKGNRSTVIKEIIANINLIRNLIKGDCTRITNHCKENIFNYMEIFLRKPSYRILFGLYL